MKTRKLLLTMGLFAFMCGCGSKEASVPETQPATEITETEVLIETEESFEETTDVSDIDETQAKQPDDSVVSAQRLELIDCSNTDNLFALGITVTTNESGTLKGIGSKYASNPVQYVDNQYDDIEFRGFDGATWLFDFKYEGKYGIVDLNNNIIVNADYDNSLEGCGDYFVGTSKNDAVTAFDVYDRAGNLKYQFEISAEDLLSETGFSASSYEGVKVSNDSSDFEGNMLSVYAIFGDITYSKIVRLDGTTVIDWYKGSAYVSEKSEDNYYPVGFHTRLFDMEDENLNKTVLLDADGNIVKEYPNCYEVMKWGNSSHAFCLCKDYNVYGSSQNDIDRYIYMDMLTGEEIMDLATSPEGNSKNYVKVSSEVYDLDGNLVADFSGLSSDFSLYGDKILYQDSSTSHYKLLDFDGIPVKDDRYFSCIPIEASYVGPSRFYSGGFFLGDADGNMCLFSNQGELIDDYGVFTSLDSLHVSFDGESIFAYSAIIEGTDLYLYTDPDSGFWLRVKDAFVE